MFATDSNQVLPIRLSVCLLVQTHRTHVVQAKIMEEAFSYFLTAAGNDKSSSCLLFLKKKKKEKKRAELAALETHAPFYTASVIYVILSLLFLHFMACTTTNVSISLLLTGNLITYAELRMKPKPKGSSRSETSSPGSVLFCLVVGY